MAMNAHDYVAELVKRGRAAQAVANGFTQEDVDLLTAAVTYNLTKPEKAAMFADMLVEESGMGIAEDKVAKIYGKVWGAYIQMKDKRSVGLIDDNKETGIQQWAKPMGVVAGIMPVTNGEATPIVKANMALKTRNAIILAPHPKCRKLNVAIVNEIRATLKKLGYPEDLVQTCDPEWVKLEVSQELMKQCDFILATGGEALVEAAYSSGTPAIGVGVGNCVSIVTGKTPMDKVAEMICVSKAYDNSTSCSTENNIIVFESCYDEFIKEMEAHGAYLCREGSEEKAKLQKVQGSSWQRSSMASAWNILSREKSCHLYLGSRKQKTWTTPSRKCWPRWNIRAKATAAVSILMIRPTWTSWRPSLL